MRGGKRINYIICRSFETQNCFKKKKKTQDFLGRTEIQSWSIHDKIKILIQLYINRIFCDIKTQQIMNFNSNFHAYGGLITMLFVSKI